MCVHKSEWGAGAEEETEPQAGPTLSAEPNVGLDPMTLRL